MMKLPRRLFSNFKLPDLSYDLHDLEPVLSREAMDLHYNKHHNTYINNYNKFSEEFLNAKEKDDQ